MEAVEAQKRGSNEMAEGKVVQRFKENALKSNRIILSLIVISLIGIFICNTFIEAAAMDGPELTHNDKSYNSASGYATPVFNHDYAVSITMAGFLL